jgi:DNA-binding transcriptional regulator YiaG
MADPLVLAVTIFVLAGLAALVYWTVPVCKTLVQYAHSGELRKRREKRAQARLMGEALRSCRVRQGLSAEYVAQAVGVTPQAVARWERGDVCLSTASLLLLAALYGVTLDELRGKTKPPEGLRCLRKTSVA